MESECAVAMLLEAVNELDFKVSLRKLNQNPGKRKSFKVLLGVSGRFDEGCV